MSGSQDFYHHLLTALGVTTMRDAAQLLGIRQSILSDCRRRGALRQDVQKILYAKGISLAYTNGDTPPTT